MPTILVNAPLDADDVYVARPIKAEPPHQLRFRTGEELMRINGNYN